MSGGNNATVSFPGRDWQTLWPTSFDDFQLDIVGFLAILGEGSVTVTAQVASLSTFFYLPRLIPAPQALLWPSRPATLPTSVGKVTAVYSGNYKEHVNYVGQVLLGSKEMPAYTTRCVTVTKRKDTRTTSTIVGRMFKGQPSKGQLRRADTISPEMLQPSVTAKVRAPLTFVALLGFSMSVALLIASLVWGDGMSMLATILLSLLSTLVGIGNKWTLKLARPAQNSPDGDVVIRYPNGSYLVVKCNEEVARELYLAPEEIEYDIKSVAVYRLISLVGTLLLMLGVIALANARLQLQFAWAGAYIFINIAQWIAAALPLHLHWDLSCYEVVESGFSDGTESGCLDGPQCPNHTEALSKAIMFTGNTQWVHLGNAAPHTAVWNDWIREAGEAAQLVKQTTGTLIDPLWPGGDTIWTAPAEWRAKHRWNEIQTEFMRENHPERIAEIEKQRVVTSMRTW